MLSGATTLDAAQSGMTAAGSGTDTTLSFSGSTSKGGEDSGVIGPSGNSLLTSGRSSIVKGLTDGGRVG